MAGGKVSAGCAGVGPGRAELLADVDACAASSLWMSRAWLAHCCAADGRAQGLAAAGAAGAGAGVEAADAAETAAPGAGAGEASPKGACPRASSAGPAAFVTLEAQVWSKFLWASWTSSKVRWASSVFCSACWSPNTKLGCWKLNPASCSSFAAALLFRKISLNRELEVFTFRFFSELGSFSTFKRTIARVLSDLAASALLLLSLEESLHARIIVTSGNLESAKVLPPASANSRLWHQRSRERSVAGQQVPVMPGLWQLQRQVIRKLELVLDLTGSNIWSPMQVHLRQRAVTCECKAAQSSQARRRENTRLL